MCTLCTGALNFSLSIKDNECFYPNENFSNKNSFYQNTVRLPSRVEGPQDTSLQRTGGLMGQLLCVEHCEIFHRGINILCNKYSVWEVLIPRRISVAHQRCFHLEFLLGTFITVYLFSTINGLSIACMYANDCIVL